VRIESIDTGNEKRDDHLRSPDFFDAPNHPEMRFTSTEITDINGNTFQMKGDLTIRGTTKPVVFETELLGTAVDNEGRQRAGFTAATTINRKDFGLTWNRVTEAGGLVVGEDVDITLDIQTIRGDA
jgi:polyisoprenoid-binding protein YceI